MASSIRLINDQAIGERGSGSQDGLGFDAYADVLAGVAKGTEGPFTVGVFGEWGTGKTSLMRMAQAKLDEDDKAEVITVWFNAWRYENAEHPIVPLVATIVRRLQENEPLLDKLGKQGATLIKTLRAIAYGFSGSASASVPTLAGLEGSFSGKDAIDRFDELTDNPILKTSLYDAAFDTLSKIHLEGKVKIVVFVDDLDRCFPDRSIKLLEAIKLVLAQPGFIFFLGVARTVIEGYLQHRYQTEFGITNFQGRRYLDKIVQLPFYIPDHKVRSADLVEKALDQLELKKREALLKAEDVILAVTQGNPRVLVRFVNNLLIDVEIGSKLENFEGVPVGAFAVTRGLQQVNEAAYRILLTSVKIRDVYIEEQKDRSSQSGVVNLSPDSELEQFWSVVGVTLRTIKEILASEAGQSWLTDKKYREATASFYQLTQVAEDPHQYDGLIVFLTNNMDIVKPVLNVLVKGIDGIHPAVEHGVYPRNQYPGLRTPTGVDRTAFIFHYEGGDAEVIKRELARTNKLGMSWILDTSTGQIGLFNDLASTVYADDKHLAEAALDLRQKINVYLSRDRD